MAEAPSSTCGRDLGGSDRVHCRKRKISCDDEDIEQDLQKKTKIVDSSVGDADIMLNSLAVHDDALLDPQPGPSRRDQLSPPRENLLNQDSSVDSFDSAFDKNNEYNQLKLEQTDTQIEKNIRGDTSRQCTSDISVAFDEPPQDISQESATSVDGVPGVSMNPGDEVLEEGGLIRAVRLMDGLNASQAVSHLLGYEDSNIPMISYDREEYSVPILQEI